MIRLGLVGVNTSHAGVFAELFNGEGSGLEGGGITAVWGESAEDAAALAEKHEIERVVGDPGEMLGAVDGVLIVDDTGGGASHTRLARPFLEAGVPTFVDKPMTLEIGEAVGLFDLAERTGAPLMSSSALRFAAEVLDLRDELGRLGKLSSATSVGPGDWYYYGVHAVELYQSVVGVGAEWVQRHVFPERDVAVIGYENGPTAVVETLRDAKYVFHLAIYGAEGWAQREVVDHRAFYRNQMGAVLEMVRTGKAPLRREQTLEVLGVLHAGVRSGETGERVYLRDVVPGETRD